MSKVYTVEKVGKLRSHKIVFSNKVSDLPVCWLLINYYYYVISINFLNDVRHSLEKVELPPSFKEADLWRWIFCCAEKQELKMTKDSLINWGTKADHQCALSLTVSRQSQYCSLQTFIFQRWKGKAWGRQRRWIDIQRRFVCVSWGTEEEWGWEFIITLFEILWFKLTLRCSGRGKVPGTEGTER